jgi:hypothetical protein
MGDIAIVFRRYPRSGKKAEIGGGSHVSGIDIPVR